MTRYKRRRARRSLPKAFAFAMPLLLLVGGLALWPSENSAYENSAYENRTDQTPGAYHAPLYAAGFPAFSQQIPREEVEDTQYLKLVNRQHAISTAVCGTRLVPLWPDISVRATDILLHETAAAAMLALYQAAGRAGIHTLFVASGYRSRGEQQELYENAADRSFVLPPGHSEHQLGLGVDILASGIYSSGGMAGSEEASWLAANAAQFGLILRYPYHKQDITAVNYEPWHFRYVGRVHAWIMGQYDFVLEEYIWFLQEREGYQTEFDGRLWYILYQRPENGMIFVPPDMDFNISGANTGGYIVTAWR